LSVKVTGVADVTNLLSSLVRIDSVTPWLIPGGAGEMEAARFMARWLEPLRVEVVIEEPEPGRANLIARLRGTGGGRTLCLNAHSDTVGYAAWPDSARVPRIKGDLMLGLGAADDKGHCAAAMLALKSVAESGRRLRGDLMVAIVADEEGASIGTEHLVAHHKSEIDGAIVLEANGLGNVLVTHQGFGWIDVIVHGAAAHGSAPDKGIDAIVHMAEVVRRMHELDQKEFQAHPHPMNGRTVFHTGTIVGGTDYATYPDRCVLGIEIGTQPGETLENRVREIEHIFAEVAATEPGFRGEVVVKIDRNPFEAAGHEELFKALSGAISGVTGRAAQQLGDNAWMDAALMQEGDIPTLVTGASGGNFHAPDEWVSLSELAQLVDVLRETAFNFCA
jgi:acetylornithine deacetylase/succinyl-diaminopimelate desuccinylase-like protein